MPNSTYSAASDNAGQMYAVVKSIRAFDKDKVASILSNIINPSERENCILATYYRTAGNIDSLLLLDSPKHFQAAAMLARALFELTVDIKLIDKVHASWLKMSFFVEVEKLRSARKMIDFAKSNPSRAIDVSSQTQFVANNVRRIEHNHRILWPPKVPGAKLPDVKHWSGLHLSKRAQMLGDPFDEMYNCQYPRLSWFVHSGLTGVANMPSEFFANMHGFALGLSISCYSTILETVIHEMKIDIADDKIYKTLHYAKVLPFTKSPEEEAILIRELLG